MLLCQEEKGILRRWSKYKDKYHLHKGLSPALNISYVNKHTSHNSLVRYELRMQPDGSAFIDRIEAVKPIRKTMTTEENENDTAHSK
jgi:hypothetical protein